MTARRHAIAVVAALALLGFAIAAHLVFPEEKSPLLIPLLSSLHAPGFAAIAAIFYALLGPRDSIASRYLLAAAGAGSIGLLAETAQIPGPRNAQWADLLTDAVGIFSALAVIASFDRRLRHRLRHWTLKLLPVAAGVGLAATLLPTLWIGFASIKQYTSMPELLTFEHRWESMTYSQADKKTPQLISAPEDWPIANSTIALSEGTGRHGNFLILHPLPDLGGYSGVSFIAAAVDGTIELTVGIRGQRPGKDIPRPSHYEEFTVTTTPQRFVLSFDTVRANAKNRSIDFEHVEAVLFNSVNPGSGKQLLIDDIRLETL